jgi:hypothetical protein
MAVYGYEERVRLRLRVTELAADDLFSIVDVLVKLGEEEAENRFGPRRSGVMFEPGAFGGFSLQQWNEHLGVLRQILRDGGGEFEVSRSPPGMKRVDGSPNAPFEVVSDPPAPAGHPRSAARERQLRPRDLVVLTLTAMIIMVTGGVIYVIHSPDALEDRLAMAGLVQGDGTPVAIAVSLLLALWGWWWSGRRRSGGDGTSG